MEFALADYEQALEMTLMPSIPLPPTQTSLNTDIETSDPFDRSLSQTIQTRIAVVYHLYGIRHFTDKNFQVIYKRVLFSHDLHILICDT